ncbi:MAG: hydantoinase/oxoprolinase family protein, partial [Armatimonadota bacterium]|nr:hydantoinase/oxoprolinase family protein [Armatimonadota bacterium]
AHPEVHLVSVSTTLATNAIVENQGSPICLILIGYSPDVLEQDGLGGALNGNPVVFVRGGHTVSGEEQAPLDLDAVRRAALENAGRVSAFAISGYFAVLNPAHEVAARRVVRETTGKPVTCGHELTSNLHAPRRALTVALNARLIPLLDQLIRAVQRMLADRGIHAPLMVVKGDGSLMEAHMALERPVETILSGPAASVVGARYLTGEEDVFVVDMGGTTTDIALLRQGRPVLNAEGAVVGGWRTMVEAVSVHTFGLGGDSEVHLSDHDGVRVGPRRVVPLSLLGMRYPHTCEALRCQLAREGAAPHDGRLVLRQRPRDGARFDSAEEEIWEALAEGPVTLEALLAGARIPLFRELAVQALVDRGILVFAGFTPTDAAHVLGLQKHWSTEAARLGAELMARRAREFSWGLGETGGAFSQRVMRRVTVQAGGAVVSTALQEAYGVVLDGGLARAFFVERSLEEEGADSREVLGVSLRLRRGLVAVGAPVSTFYPEVAKRLHTHLSIPPHAEIANALGAVAGGIVQNARALVKPAGDGYRLHLPTEMRDFEDRDAAISYARAVLSQLVEEQARAAGAGDVRVEVRCNHQVGHGRDAEVYLGTELLATAVGRPRLGAGN